ncbi:MULTISPECIES: outer membrane beta-barrel protein [Sphingobacterium]|uniref:Outer membrane beta-barrel protein n=1 Tax=Sphingobacterium populi TaxID=1812824 RepID=A0ABW5U8K4_9SPHI|nr:outer membrane beta-barrel protein [Sphingobacterium sp. CFCC 11742]
MIALHKREKYTKTITLLVVYFVSILFAQAQIGIGVQGGGNLSKAIGSEFRSSNRIGLQFGAFLSYGLNPYFTLQLEPGYNISRIRTNETTQALPQGITKATRSVDYFNLPLLAKLTLTPQFALLAGIEFNKLLNEDRHLLNNNQPAFQTNLQTGYVLGIEFRKLYLRYRRHNGFSQINSPNDSYIQQLQIGLRFRLM